MAPKQMGFINLPDVLKRVMMRPCCGSGLKPQKLKLDIPRLEGGVKTPETEKLDQSPPKSPRVFTPIFELMDSLSEDAPLEEPETPKIKLLKSLRESKPLVQPETSTKQTKKRGKVLSRQVLSRESIDKL